MASPTDYSTWEKEDLIKKLKALEKRKKYGLVWDSAREPEKVVLDCQNELPVLKEIKDKEIQSGKDDIPHILIEGDNYHALSVLSYTHEKSIDVIYIDPPYNTGARDWKYNNNFVDGEDPYRHTKWLSFMSNRLSISKNLLKDDGIICVTVDDYEIPRLWLLMEDIFGEMNHLGTVAIRSNPGGRKSKRKIAAQHEYALFFSRRTSTEVAKTIKPLGEKSHTYVADENGEYYEARNLRKEGADSLAKSDSKRYYPIYFDPNTGKLSTKNKYTVEILPIDTNGQKRIWRRDKDIIDSMSEKNDLFVKETKYGLQIYFKFRGGIKGETPKSFWDNKLFSASEHGTQTLDKILGVREAFPFPKSPYAVMECINVASSNKNAIILDFMAGSGTTGHAVLDLNKEDGGHRQFILCTNNENNICTEVCYPRIQRVMKGYKNSKGEDNEGLGGNLKYYATSFVPAASTDKNKELLTRQSIEMLTLKEGTFDKVTDNLSYVIYRNSSKFTGIILDQRSFSDFKKAVSKVNKPISLYIFSLADEDFSDDFADMKGIVKICSIPEAILRVYRRIFR